MGSVLAESIFFGKFMTWHFFTMLNYGYFFFKDVVTEHNFYKKLYKLKQCARCISTQRSMSGTRDTEIAVGCYQPTFLDENPFGEVHMFRMSLWTGLLRSTEPVFRYPGTIECMARVKQLAQHNWEQYVGPEGSVTPGLLLTYPLGVLHNGFVESLPGFEEFPDFPSGSKVMGKKSAVLPQKLTT